MLPVSALLPAALVTRAGGVAKRVKTTPLDPCDKLLGEAFAKATAIFMHRIESTLEGIVRRNMEEVTCSIAKAVEDSIPSADACDPALQPAMVLSESNEEDDVDEGIDMIPPPQTQPMMLDDHDCCHDLVSDAGAVSGTGQMDSQNPPPQPPQKKKMMMGRKALAPRANKRKPALEIPQLAAMSLQDHGGHGARQQQGHPTRQCPPLLPRHSTQPKNVPAVCLPPSKLQPTPVPAFRRALAMPNVVDPYEM
jgi:hypothetical protein